MRISLTVFCRIALKAAVIVVLLAACFAPAYAIGFVNVTGTMTATGTFGEGSGVTYTVILTNVGSQPQLDNPGDEFTDALPPGLTLVAAGADGGNTSVNFGTNTVTWNGVVPALQDSVNITIHITATINAGTAGQTITNYGAIMYDADDNGSNETFGPVSAEFTVSAGPFVNVTGTKTVSGTFAEGGSVTYTVILTNRGEYAQPDNSGHEFIDVLPPSLQLVNADADSGTTYSIDTGTNTFTWDGLIAPLRSTVTIRIYATINAGTAGQTITNQGTINYDADLDFNSTNESTRTVSASFTVFSPSGPISSPDAPPAAPPPPATPLCMDQNAVEDGVVRAGIPDAIAYAINCRALYENGAPTQWLGGDLYNAGSIGIAGLTDLGIEQVVDIFSPSGMNYFNGGAVFCLKGEGTLIWLAASNSPRHADIIGSYPVPEFPGFTCATLFEPGTLVLVSRTPAQ